MAHLRDRSAAARTADVLDPTFVQGVEDLSIEELRRRRDLAMVVRDYHSYLRRLIQTREDLMAAERARRAAGAEPVPVIERLTAVLADTPRGPSRGEALRATLTPIDMEEAEGRVHEVVAPGAAATPESLSDAELERVLQALGAVERSVSADRAAVFRVHDRLQEELKHRYQQDPALIPTDL